MRLGKTKSSDLGPACLIHFCTASRSRGRDLELNRVLSLVLHDHGARRYLLAMADIPDLEADQIAAASLAVDLQVEEGQLAHPAVHLRADRKRPDVFELERCFLAGDLGLVSWLAVTSADVGFHHELPSS